MKQNKLRIAIVVHGRFHAFDLARELINQGHETVLFTNYPKWAVRRFGISGDNVRSFWLHGVISRLLSFLCSKINFPYPEALSHKMFGRWAAKAVKKESWDVVQCWSGVSEELLYSLRRSQTLKVLERGSSHIKTQASLLKEEEERVKTTINRPSRWMINREEREYHLADYIMVLSKFAYDSFLNQGIKQQKLLLIPLGAPVEDFRPPPHVIEERYRRIISGERLRVLYVGIISFRKGMWDMAAIVSRLNTDIFHFRLLGLITKEVKKILPRLRRHAELISRQPQAELPKWYAWADLFLFTTIEDGYPAVLSQAQASGLPLLSTTNCAGPDIIIDGKTGWVLPIRNPQAFTERLMWCNLHRTELARMTKAVYNDFKLRKGSDVAKDFATTCAALLNRRKKINAFKE